MSCIRSKKKIQTKKTIEQTIEINRYNFTPQEFEMYKQKFERMSNGSGFTKDEFKQHMRISEFKMLGFISDRIFNEMNKSHSGTVSLPEYLTYMDIMNYGSSETKAKQSYNIISGSDPEGITFKSFKKWLISASKMKNLNEGAGFTISESEILEFFKRIDKNNDETVDFKEYFSALHEIPQFNELVQVLEHGLTERMNVPIIQDYKKEDPQYGTKIKLLKGKILGLVEYLEGVSGNNISDLPVNASEIRINLLNNNPRQSSMWEVRGSDRRLTSARILRTEVEKSRRATVRLSPNFAKVYKEKPLSKHQLIKKTLEGLLENLSKLEKGENIENDPELNWELSKTWTRNIPKKIALKKNDVIYWGDDDWNLILNMMLGIQKSVKDTVAGTDCFSKVNPDMFVEKVKHKLLRSQVKSNKTFKFRDYAPSIFERIRKLYNIKPSEYIRSLGMEKIMHALVANEFSSLTGMCTTGKSGSFFYYSDDGKYMLKTLSSDEYYFFRKFLPEYYFHLYKNPHTLITRFFGFHKIIVCGAHKKLYFVVMGNLFKGDYDIDVKYDLKGSTLGRLTDDSEDRSIARKDNNFISEGIKVHIGKKRKEHLMEQIRKDVEMLQRNLIIDYSLLLGVSRVGQKVPKKVGFAILSEVDDGGMMSKQGKDLYFLGVIDILTFYGAKKKLEHFFKTRVYKKDEVSCAPPDFYADRFLKFMNQVFE